MGAYLIVPAADVATFRVTTASGHALNPSAMPTPLTDYFFNATVLDDPANASMHTALAALTKVTFSNYAHRGWMGVVPQNTLPADAYAIANGADGVEGDIAVSLDNVNGWFHDDTVNALTDGTGTFTSLTWAYLESLTFDGVLALPYPTARIPSLASVCALIAAAPTVTFLAESKRYSSLAQIPAMIDVIVGAGVKSQTIFNGSWDEINAARAYDGTIAIAWVYSQASGHEADILALAALGGSVYMTADQAIVDASFVSLCAANNVGLIVFTIDTLLQLMTMTNLGVTKLLCNYPWFCAP